MNDEKKVSLIDLVSELRATLIEVEELDGEILPDLEERLDSLSDAFEMKVDRCLLVAQEFEAMAQVHKERADIQAAYAKSLKGQAGRLREYVKTGMIGAEVAKLETEHFPRVKLAKTAPKVVIDELVFWSSDPPSDIIRQKDPEPDKKAIKAALKAGDEITGASMSEPGVSLRWK